MKYKYFSTLAIAFATSVIAFTAQAAEVKNIVIVHGALADGSGWRQATEILEKRGFNVTIVQEPITSLADDVAATNRVLDLQDGPTLLVGHSYGGMKISPATPRRFSRSSGLAEQTSSLATTVAISMPSFAASLIAIFTFMLSPA